MLKLIFFFLIIYRTSFALEYTKNEGAHLKVLNKLTTKNYSLIIPLGQSLELGDIELTVYQCLSLEKEKSNDAHALLKIQSNNKDEEYDFLGWLIKSSPSLVNIEDPVFNVTLKDCILDDPLFYSLKEIN
ncbi:DUF2155 domain-containing protein [Rickettsiales bacterium]|nr:DUF2155 domain-containing protein [Rickettsiales bacterium]